MNWKIINKTFLIYAAICFLGMAFQRAILEAGLFAVAIPLPPKRLSNSLLPVVIFKTSSLFSANSSPS